MDLSAHIPQAPKKKSPEGTGDGTPGAPFLSVKERILRNNPLLSLLSAAFVLLGWAIIGVIFAGCITPRRHEKEVGIAYKMGRADGSKECEGKLQELRIQLEEKNDRLRKFNQIYQDGRLRGGHVDPAGK